MEYWEQKAQEEGRWKVGKKGKKPAMAGRSSILYRKQVAVIIAEFRANGCALCPEKMSICLTAHHRDGSKKSFGISKAIAEFRVSPERLKTELAKCVCVCRNCHAKIEAGALQPPEQRVVAAG